MKKNLSPSRVCRRSCRILRIITVEMVQVMPGQRAKPGPAVTEDSVRCPCLGNNQART